MRRLSALLAWLFVSTIPAVAFSRPVAPFAADAGVHTRIPSEGHRNLTFTAESLRVGRWVDSHDSDLLHVRREWYFRCHDRATRTA